jgi:molybdopterin molybdotransferase
MMIPAELKPVLQLADRLLSVASPMANSDDLVPVGQATGRVLTQEVVADRDSPAADVSAMDGYALKIGDATDGKRLPVVGISRPGAAPPPCPADGSTIQIFTGAVVPDGCDLVLRREDVSEIKGQDTDPITAIELLPHAYQRGSHIRKRGENARRGTRVIEPGALLRAGHIAAAASFGYGQLSVSRPIRVRIIVTGDELCDTNSAVAPWQIRDSNGSTLESLLRGLPWIDAPPAVRAADDFDQLVQTITMAMNDADAVLLTGGVSMGDFDFVPAAVRQAGVEQAFHKLPIRPGKPIFGGVGPGGKLVLGLPGNPVSAAVGCVRFARPMLAKMAGCRDWNRQRPRLHLEDAGDRSLPLVWYRLVRLTAQGDCGPVPSLGSGDLVSMAESDGFVEIPSGATGPGPWPFWAWQEAP